LTIKIIKNFNWLWQP